MLQTMLSFGYLLPTQIATSRDGWRSGELIELGVEAERLGFDAVWLPDSPFQYGVPDPLVLLGALAARTERITLATGVLLAALRQPALLAQQLASVDALAEGRLLAGFGLGFSSPDSEQQFAAAGVPFASRAARLVESIELMRLLWSAPGRPVRFDGAHVSVSDLVLSPAPAREGGPPIWLAGAGPRAERRVGELADGWLPYLPSAAAYAEGWQRVRSSAAQAGRPAPVAGLYLTIALDDSAATAKERLRTTLEQWYRRPFEQISALQATYAGTPQDLGTHLEPYIEAGLRHVVLRVADAPAPGLEAAATALEQLKAAGFSR